MNVPCPHCQHSITLKGVKPGRYKPTCPQCGKAFVLAVAADLTMTASAPATSPDATAPPPAPKVPASARPPSRPRPAASPSVTAPPTDPNATAPPPSTDPNVTAPLPAKAAPQPPRKVPSAPAARPAGKAAAAPSATAAESPRARSADHAPTQATGEWQPPAARSAAVDQTADFGSQEDLGATTPPPESGLEQTEAEGAPSKTPGKARPTRRKAEEGGDLPADAPRALGGYEVLKRLGQGGMGTVYLARQVSLDRKVALKTMNREWAQNPRFLTRFIREAYAAAQLVHHNIVQIYDIGEQDGTHFFSMEFVRGSNLGELLKEHGKLDPEAAVGYVLQAARGLKYAHDQGMVHRDVKPDNLMLDEHGIVKVADLGLVKTPQAAAHEEAAEEGAAPPEDAETTAAGVAMGTPAYMAPEQGLNAAGVDQRADIYSLGCTLYGLLTGRPPFQGKTAIEVMTKHQTEPIIRPETIVKRVPGELSDVLMKMLAKKPTERYSDLGAVIADLEKFLGVHSAGPFTPKQEHADELEETAKAFHAAPAARLRGLVKMGFFGGCAALFVLMLLFGWVKVATAALGLALFTAICTFIATGMANHTHLFSRARELVFDSRWTDWLTWALGLVLVVVILWLAGLLWWWVGVLILSVALAAAYVALIDRRLAAQRRAPLERVEKLLKSLRLRGVEETSLQQLVCKYAGHHWEELYETLYGYDALLTARQAWSASMAGRKRPQFATWRDPVVRWIDTKQKARREARERKLLAKVEQKALEAKGVSASQARAQAEASAEDLVEQAAVLKQEATLLATVAPQEAQAERPRITARSLAAGPRYRLADGAPAPRRRRSPVRLLVRQVLSPKVRFLAGAALVLLCLLWVRQNELLSTEHLESALEGDTSSFKGLGDKIAAARPLSLPLVPESVTAPLFNSFNPGIAGLLLIVAALAASVRVISLCIAGALVALLGPLVPVPPDVLPLAPQYLWAAVGAVVAILGLIIGRFVR